MFEGIEVKQLRRFADERGFFMEIMRKDWQLLDDERCNKPWDWYYRAYK
jgi:dTDP-4-dehydrorhamnose 3,5-epimerase